MDKKITGILDNRLNVYRKNCARIPSVTGDVIPEAVRSIREYREKILERIYSDISEYDSERIISHEWLNARGAIARFERGTIEIRIIDIQESPVVDFSIAEAVTGVLEILAGKDSDTEKQLAIDTGTLSEIYSEAVSKGMKSVIRNRDYLELFGIEGISELSIRDLWKELIKNMKKVSCHADLESVETILDEGSLSERILKSVEKIPVLDTYKELASCLSENRMFKSC